MPLLAEFKDSLESAPPNDSAMLKKALRSLLVPLRDKAKQDTSPNEWGPVQYQMSQDYLQQEHNISLVAHRIASYFPIRSELDLCLLRKPGWLFPKMDGQELLWFELGAKSKIELNKFGIPEAPREQCFELSEVGETIVMYLPALAVSLDGYRLGYGKGFYDRCLAQHGKRIVTICCVHSKLLFDTLPHEHWDEKVDLVFTENGVVEIASRDQLLSKLGT